MDNDLIQVHLDGPADSGNEVYLDDLKVLCSCLSSCLNATEQALTDSAPTLKYRLEELSKGSIQLTLASGSLENGGLYNQTAGLFNNTVKALQEGTTVDSRLGHPALEAYRKLGDTLLRRSRSLLVSGVSITTRFVANVDDVLGQSLTSEGSLKGRVERLNIHNKNEFALYTPLSEQGITCTFDNKLFDQVREAVGKNITVMGTMHFHGLAGFPDRVNVSRIDIHPEDDELPTLSSLRGMLPSAATSGLSTIDFVNMVRHGQE